MSHQRTRVGLVVLAAILSTRRQIGVDPMRLTVLHKQVGSLLMTIPVDRTADDGL